MLAEILEPIETKKGTMQPGQLVELSQAAIYRLAGKVRLIETNQPPVAHPEEWEHDLCIIHGDFMGTAGNCPRSIDDCFISYLIDSSGDLEKLRPYEIGHGITCGDVLDCCHGAEDEADLRKYPACFVLVAESERKREALSINSVKGDKQ